MAEKPTYEELELRIIELEKKVAEHNHAVAMNPLPVENPDPEPLDNKINVSQIKIEWDTEMRR